MGDNDSESQTTTAATFSFASGQIITLNQHQIEQIPYFCALVSSADHFESARDEHGHIKLDPHIDYQYFSFALHALSFHSVRQFFTCLPKRIHVIPLIALLDFLGLAPQPDPSLNEVNSTFFSTIVYSPLLDRHLQIVRPCGLQEIAVRFGIAMAKEEYDLTKCEVVDQIYWFVMFIMSAHKWFGPRLRHHIFTIAKHCFSFFKPSLLKPLKKLKRRAEEERRKLVSITDDQDCRSDAEDNSILEQTFDLDANIIYDHNLDRWDRFLFPRPLTRRKELLLHRKFLPTELDFFWFWKRPVNRDILETTYNRLLEIAYEQLQTAISEAATTELSQRRNQCELMRARINVPWLFHSLERKTLPERMDDIFTDELVQEEIRAFILEELCILTPELEQKHAELMREIRSHREYLERSDQDVWHEFTFLCRHYDCDLPEMQNEALSHELLLSKLHQNSNIVVEELLQRVLDGLREITLKRFNKWQSTQQAINVLRRQLNNSEESEKTPYTAEKTSTVSNTCIQTIDEPTIQIFNTLIKQLSYNEIFM